MESRKAKDGIRPLDEYTLRMLKIMTHEIRGPLVSAMAGLKVVLHGSYGGMDPGVSDKLRGLHAHLNRLLGQSDDFLMKACCVKDVFPAHRETLDLLDDVLAEVLDELSGELQSKRILMDRILAGMPAGTAVAASRLGMRIVFRNLIRNAVNYGGAGCTIVCGYQEQPDHHRLNVYNSGASIPAEKRERLFTKFGTIALAAEARDTGVGLGLFLSREIVCANGGTIWYEAPPGGSNFVFTVPKTPVPSLSDDNGAGI